MFRTIRELFRPRAKCERVGHRLIKIRHRVLLQPSTSWRGVADEAIRTQESCRRCGEPFGPPIDGERSSIQSLTLPADMARELRDAGVLIRERLP